MPERPVVLATAPLRGPGLDKLRSIADVVEEPWISETTMRLLNEQQLADRIRETDANVVICEADRCAGPVLELPLLAIGSTRGDPTNVDVDGATAKRIPVLHAPGRNADAVAEMTVALLFAVNRHVLRADADVRAGNVFSNGTIPYQRFRAWQLAGRTAGVVGLGAKLGLTYVGVRVCGAAGPCGTAVGTALGDCHADGRGRGRGGTYRRGRASPSR